MIVFDSETGKFKRMWGAFGNPPPSTLAPNAPAPQPQTTPDGPPEFGLPHAIKVSRDGVVYLADRINNRIQMFTREGKFLKQVRVTNEGSNVVPVPAGFAFSPDRNQQFLYVVDSGPMRVVIFDRQTMTQIGALARRARTPASSTSSTTWRPTRKEISTRRRSSTTGGRRDSSSIEQLDAQRPERRWTDRSDVASAVPDLDLQSPDDVQLNAEYLLVDGDPRALLFHGLRQRVRIGHHDRVVQASAVCAQRESLDERSRRPERHPRPEKLRVDAASLDYERVAFPTADRVAEQRIRLRGRVLPTVHVDGPHGVELLDSQQNRFPSIHEV